MCIGHWSLTCRTRVYDWFKWPASGAVVVSAVPTSSQRHAALLAVGASNALEGGRLAEFANREHPSVVGFDSQYNQVNVLK